MYTRMSISLCIAVDVLAWLDGDDIAENWTGIAVDSSGNIGEVCGVSGRGEQSKGYASCVYDSIDLCYGLQPTAHCSTQKIHD